jgi:hypothetical protein
MERRLQIELDDERYIQSKSISLINYLNYLFQFNSILDREKSNKRREEERSRFGGQMEFGHKTRQRESR